MMMTPGPKPNVDPLEVARQQLDFEAIANDAPSIKKVMFSAQTMAPFAPPKPWGKIGLTTACFAVTLLLVFAPLIPKTAMLALVKVQFEEQFTQDQAQDLVFGVTRDLPDNALLGVNFGKAPGQSVNDHTGKLQLSLTAFNHSPEALADVTKVILLAVAPESQPFFSATLAVKSRTWSTLPSLVRTFIDGNRQQPGYPLSGVGAARDALNLEQLVAFGLAQELEQAGYMLKRFEFLGAQSGQLPSGFDYSLPAWPTWIAVDLQDYRALSDHQQAEARLITEDYLRSVNLAPSSLMMVTEATDNHPVVITVTRPDGNRDAYLSAQVQAWVDVTCDTGSGMEQSQMNEAIEEALNKVLPDAQAIIKCREDIDSGTGSSEPHFEATVELTGNRKSILYELQQTYLRDNDYQEY